MSDKNFSIVIPTHNGEKYITSAIESILNQSYPHFQIIVLENCSTDGTVELMRSFNDPRLHIAPSREFLSLEKNWARSLELELSEFTIFLGHDDILYPNFLEAISALIEAEPAASIYQGHYHYINPEGKITASCQRMAYRETGDEYLHSVHQFCEDFSGTGYVFRSADFKQLGGFPPIHKLLLGDALCWYYLAARSYRVASPEYLCAFRVHDSSTTQSSTLLDFHFASKQYLETLEKTPHFDNPQNQELAKAFIDRFLNGMYKGALYGLVRDPEPIRIQQFFEVRRQLLALSDAERLFTMRGKAARIYRTILELPTNWLRETACVLLMTAIRLRRKLMQPLRQPKTPVRQ